GAGARLGAVVPQIVSSAPAPSSSGPSTDSVDNVAKAQAEVNIDENSPVTQIQIRLPNGQRVSGKFNQAHTVGAIRNFLVTAYPDMAATAFQLMTTFPNRVIDDESIDLKDAGLINAVVVMSLKEWLGIEKLQKLARIIKQIGGVRAAIKKRYLDKKYIPYSTTRTKIQAWQPGQKKQE
ncbi:UBX domain protein, partial [Teladorsagia circumcincta]